MVWQSLKSRLFSTTAQVTKKCIWAAPNLLNESFEHYGLRIHWIAPLYRGCCVFTIMVGQLSACRCEVHLRMTIQVKSQYYAQALWPSPRAGRWRLARVRAQEHAWEWVLARPRRGGRPAPACAGDSAVVGHEWDSGVLTLLLPGGSRRQALPTGRHRSARSKQACLPPFLQLFLRKKQASKQHRYSPSVLEALLKFVPSGQSDGSVLQTCLQLFQQIEFVPEKWTNTNRPIQGQNHGHWITLFFSNISSSVDCLM